MELGDQWQEILGRIIALLARAPLSTSEQDFLESMEERLEQYKSRTYMSEAQEEWLDRIEEKYQ
jgi:hypothetical protein